MKRFMIEYITSANYNTRHKIFRGHTEEEAVNRFLNMMKTMNLTKYDIEIFSVQEV